ncbi:MAG: penicillin acylase family protein [Opitutaceae bacterium]
MRLYPFRFILTFGAAAILLNASFAEPITQPITAALTPADLNRWQEHARQVTIIRDTWGIAHVFGQTDANTVFGLLYAQAEDDFNRIEFNYINALGRLAEVEGEKELYRDLRMKLFIDPVELHAKYTNSPKWLRALMDAFADGLNFYLYAHPGVHPKLITHFEPWMALAFTEGSIGGDIESISLKSLEAFYGPRPALALASPDSTATDATTLTAPPEAQGSNGFAISPAKSASGHALLLINPHTSFYFRPELHAVSTEGLNAYGAATWGQFFVYQGFNDRIGWMHTSNGADVIDEYRETIIPTPEGPAYRYGKSTKPLIAKKITLRYRIDPADSSTTDRVVTAYFSHHGPIVRTANGQWIAVKMMNDPVPALTQSYQRTKARTYADFKRVMALRTNTSNNTVYADADGNIAYFHGNFAPRRDSRFNWKLPVDGSDPATEWRGLHEVEETIHLLNPASGWIQNTNNWPFSAAGTASPKLADYPTYLWSNPENARGLNAVRVLSRAKSFTIDSLIAAAYDPTLPAFETLLPKLCSAFDALPAEDSRRAALAAPIAALRAWDHRAAVDSIATTLAILWAQSFGPMISEAKNRELVVVDHLVATLTAPQCLDALTLVTARLTRDFGTWETPWGEINRFQRPSGDITPKFDDTAPSRPIAFAPSDWGSLPAFGVSGPPQTTKRIYGNRGNSFVAVVEFGPRVQAKTLLAGGVSGDPKSPHFNDQAALYAAGKFKDAWFYRADIEKNAERTYHPGQ